MILKFIPYLSKWQLVFQFLKLNIWLLSVRMYIQMPKILKQYLESDILTPAPLPTWKSLPFSFLDFCNGFLLVFFCPCLFIKSALNINTSVLKCKSDHDTWFPNFPWLPISLWLKANAESTRNYTAYLLSVFYLYLLPILSHLRLICYTDIFF